MAYNIIDREYCYGTGWGNIIQIKYFDWFERFDTFYKINDNVRRYVQLL